MKQYQDKEWLYKKYWKEMLSIPTIAKLCETNQTTILYWMKKFDISRRSISEAYQNIPKETRKKMGKLFYKGQTAWNKGIPRLKETKLKISESHKGKILSERHKNKISRSLSLLNHNICHLNKKAIEWINGELLGDAGLEVNSKYSASINYGSKYKEYIQYVNNILKSFGINKMGKIRKCQDKNWGNFSYKYRSLSYNRLSSLYKKWYPEGKKIIPKDLELTPITLRQHYIGDGSLAKPARGKNRPYIILCTNGFPISDVKWLVNKLINLGFKAKRQPSANAVYISTYSTKDFLDYIGKCPVKCYEYKWAY